MLFMGILFYFCIPERYKKFPLRNMFIKQLYTNCLAEAAYYIESDGEAAIIDPLRDIEGYLQLSHERNAVIKYIFETHFHADFVSGHLDLSQATGAPIIYGPKTETAFPVTVASDGQVFRIGKAEIKVLHTPGHTIESTCYLLKDEEGMDHAIFTGDTLFVGDVGRPDLIGGNTTKEEMAGLLYDSLQSKILPLADDVIVYPAHGPGSSCGKNLGKETFSTIGQQKEKNYALNQESKDEFVKAVTTGLSTPPSYFPVNAQINKEGYESLSSVLAKGMKPLSVEEFNKKINEDYLVLDTRPSHVFTGGFVPGSIFIGLEGKFAEWAGSLLPFDKPIILVTEEGKEKESIVRLARVGFANVEGYLDGGFDAWLNAGETPDMIIDVEPSELVMDLPFDNNLVVVDVRKEVEFGDGHIKNAVNIPLATMSDPASMANINDSDNLYVHCAGGYRSVIAASLLKRQGINNLRNVLGGWSKIKTESGIHIEKDAAVLN